MARIRLGATPETIRHTVTAPLPDGTQGEIAVTYRYRTRKQFAELLDRTFGAGAAPGEAGPDSLVAATQLGIEANAGYILDIATGWDMDAPFDRQHVERLCDELPGVALAIMTAYRQAITEGRLGN